jgi:C4-type Zn-finger protein
MAGTYWRVEVRPGECPECGSEQWDYISRRYREGFLRRRVRTFTFPKCAGCGYVGTSVGTFDGWEPMQSPGGPETG